MVDLREEGRGITNELVPVVDILSLVQYLWDSHGLHITDESLAKFWDHAHKFFPWAPGHPASRGHIPCSLYGDDARYTSSAGFIEKVIVLNISFPLWRPLSTRNSRFTFFAIRQSLCVEELTLFPILRYVTWCCNILFSGCKLGVSITGVEHVPK